MLRRLSVSVCHYVTVISSIVLSVYSESNPPWNCKKLAVLYTECTPLLPPLGGIAIRHVCWLVCLLTFVRCHFWNRICQMAGDTGAVLMEHR